MSTTIDQPNVGSARRRVDGLQKVTGSAKYAAEFNQPGLLHGYVVTSGIAKGQITRIDTVAAEAVPGVVTVFTHENRPHVPASDDDFQDDVAPPGQPLRPLFNDRILYSGQPIALVVADSFAAARFAASLVKVSAEAETPSTDLIAAQDNAIVPPEKRSGIQPPPEPRGDAKAAFASAPVKVEAEYHIASEHHNPMEPHATTVVWNGDGSITVYDKVQGVMNTQGYLSAVFGLKKENVRVISPFVGGAFGSGLRPQYQAFLATMAALALRRSVRVELTRDQMFTFTYRPEAINSLAVAANQDGTLCAIRHEAIERTSTYEDYQEVVVNWSGLLYHCDNVHLDYKIARLDTATPGDMRAPGAPTGTFGIECAMDELAFALKMDPLELRMRNFAEKDENDDKPFTSRELRAAVQAGADKFGWFRRSLEPRSMREGRELIGWGMAAGMWEALMMPHTVRAILTSDGKLEVACATADIGTGTYTVMTQVAADALGVAMDDVAAKLGDTTLPNAPVEGGSWTAASVGTAVHMACTTLAHRLFEHARRMDGSPLGNADFSHVVFRRGRIELRYEPNQGVALGEVLNAAGLARIEVEETAEPDPEVKKNFSQFTHAACFVEVRVDEQLGVIRVTRVVHAVAAGKIINLQTARSQVLGATVFGIGMALEEESMLDHRIGRFMNHNLAEYHIPVNADVPGIDVIFVEEHDDKANPLGVKGVGEIGIVAAPAAIANAVFHATGKRVRDLPITIDKLLD